MRVPLDLLAEPGATVSPIRVYGTIRSRAGFEPAAENFLVAWPSVTTIARETGLSRATVIRTLRWLEDRDYILHDRRPNRSSMYTVIVWRAWFQELIRLHGRAEAIRLLRRRMGEAGDASRRDQSREAGERSARQARDSARKSQACDLPQEGAVRESQACDLPGSKDATSRVSGMRPRSVDQENCGSENRGASGDAPLSVLPIRPEAGNPDPNEKRRRRHEEHWEGATEMVKALAREKAMPR